MGTRNKGLVGEVGFEPTRPKAHAPKACASTIPPLPHCCRSFEFSVPKTRSFYTI